jgi:hypothetical protein
MLYLNMKTYPTKFCQFYFKRNSDCFVAVIFQTFLDEKMIWMKDFAVL